MIYTLKEGVDDKSERFQKYLLRGLPIVIAAMIAVVGAFSQANNGGDSNNQEPLAIYTAPVSDFGAASNPQGNGGDTQSTNSGNTARNASTPAEQARLSDSSQRGSGSAATPASSSTSALPVGGLGGGDSGGGGGSCFCETVSEILPPPPVDPGDIEVTPPPLPPVPTNDNVLPGGI